jgi:hypothetical protein
MSHLKRWILPLAACASALVAAAADGPALALAMGQERQHHLAALEYRRLAMSTNEAVTAGRYYWLAAHAYASGHDWPLAGRMLDRAEDAAPVELALSVSWLRAEQALAERDWKAAGFYFESVQTAAADDAWRGFAARGMTAARLRDGDVEGARVCVPDAERQAVEQYAARRDKKPWVGGLLGLAPGLGYLYSGEIGNAVRSLLLNGLFIWGMTETAEEEQWGVFAVLTFAELTWYSGSIYGGIDAAQRHNQCRLDEAVDAVRGDQRPQPDLSRVPVFTLGFQF